MAAVERARDFGRVITAMVTPFDSDGNFSVQRTRVLSEYIANNGSNTIVVAGTTGESPTLNEVERARLLDTVLDEVGDVSRVIAGTSTYDTRESVHLSRMAQEQGAHGLLLVTPYYNKPPQEGLLRHFSEIASAVDIPVIVYNVPSRTNVNMTAETVLKLDERFANIVGLKEAVGLPTKLPNDRTGRAQAQEVIDGKSAKFEVWSGNDDDTLEMLEMGGFGVVSVASHVVGNQIQAMIDAQVRGFPDLANDWNTKLSPLFRALFPPESPVASPAAIKDLLNTLGIEVGSVRSPLVEVGERYSQRLHDVYVAATP